MYFLICPATLGGKSFNNSSKYIKMSCSAKHLHFSPLGPSLKVNAVQEEIILDYRTTSQNVSGK